MDVRDILGLGAATPKSSSAGGSRVAARLAKRPEGMSREVFNLTGVDELPSVFPAGGFRSKSFKDKRQRQRTNWVHTAFRNPARNDNLELRHWVQKGKESQPYPFARFNERVFRLEYSDAVYEQLLATPEWTREETDLLVDLCAKFDMRFVVVADQYAQIAASRTPPLQARTTVDLKERFYSMALLLGQINGSSVPRELVEELKKQPFSRQVEIERKRSIERLCARTKEEEQREMKIIEEARAIEADRKRREREAAKQAKVQGKQKRAGARGPRTAARSSRLVSLPGSIPPASSRSITNALSDAGLGTAFRPVPTEAICNAYDALRTRVKAVLDLKEQVGRLEYSIRMHQALLRQRGIDPDAPPTKAAGSSGKAAAAAASPADNGAKKPAAASSAAARPPADSAASGAKSTASDGSAPSGTRIKIKIGPPSTKRPSSSADPPAKRAKTE